MNRQAQGVVMLLLGTAALRVSLTDLHLRYVKDSLQPFLIAASGLLILAGAMTLWYEWRPRWSGRTPPPEVDDGHGHGRGGPRVGWLLVAPVLGLLLVTPPALGSYSASTAGIALTPERVAELPALPEYVDPVPLTMVDYAARSIWDDGRTMAGRRVLLTGFLVAGQDQPDPYLARLTLSCCAADARPIKVGLAGAAPTGLADGTWLEVIGSYTAQTGVDPINEATIPYLAVESWREVPEPREPYE